MKRYTVYHYTTMVNKCQRNEQKIKCFFEKSFPTFYIKVNGLRHNTTMAKILIIGGGVAGLSAGIHARLQGHRAIVCERQSMAGGNLTGWHRGAYHIDNCIHWLTGTNPHTDTYRLWQTLGMLGDGVSLYQAESLYTCEIDGKTLSLYNDLSRLQAEMLAVSPADKKSIRRLIRAVETVQALCRIQGEKHDKGFSLTQTAWKTPSLLYYFKRSIGDVAKTFRHKLLRAFLTCFIGEEFSSLALLVVYATFCGNNGALPVGGSLAAAKRITERFETLGGELLLGKTATKIHFKNGKATSVSFTDGTNIRADYIVCATDTKTTFEKLLRLPIPKRLQKQYENPAFKRFSSYHTAFACEQKKLPFRGDFIFPMSREYKDVLRAEYIVLRDFSHEQDFAPHGETVLQTLTFCDEQTAKEFISLRNDKAAYTRKKQEIAQALQAVIQKKFPKLNLRFIDAWTPATYARYTGADTGSWMSFLFPKNTLPLRLPSEIPTLKNVFLATQWQQAPGGLPTAADMGKRAIERIVKQESSLINKVRLALPKRTKRKRAKRA